MCWAVWKQRNRMVWEGTLLPARRVALQGVGLLNDWCLAQSADHAPEDGEAPIRKWSKPHDGWTTINVGAALFPSDAACSMIRRNSQGHFVGAQVLKVQGWSSSYGC